MTIKVTEDHIKRINKALNYIQQNLDQSLTLDELSSIACFSPFHFHRIFSAYIGESLNGYIRRIKLERAAMKLCYTSNSITELAFNAGYETPSAFTGAFKQLFGKSPSSFRKDHSGIWPPFYSGKQVQQIQKGDPIRMDAKIVKREETRVIYVRATGNYKVAAEKAWKALCGFAFPKGLVEDNAEYIGISYDDPDITETEKLRYDACITVNNDMWVDKDIETQTIPGGSYAIFKHTGPYEGLHNIYKQIFRHWLPESDKSLRDAPCFEKYLNDASSTTPEKLETEIFIPID